jgi:hypothetical protein
MSPGTVAEQRDITERWTAVGLVSGCDVRHCLDGPSIRIVQVEPHGTVDLTRHSFTKVEKKHLAMRDPVQYAQTSAATSG